MSARLAVLGHPIAHSKSPALHAAAYSVLGLDWSYDAQDVTGETLGAFIESRDGAWRGLSLTMPLKRDVLPLLHGIDHFAELTGGANTVLFDGGKLRGFNTDVHGVVEAFRGVGIERLGSVRVLGGGATAASVLVAVQRMGAERVALAVRAPERLGSLISLAERLDLALTVETLGTFDPAFVTDAVVSTLPNGTELSFRPAALAAVTVAGGALFDVAYEPWPTVLAAGWAGPVIPGLEMLAHQALVQVRIFVNASPDAELPGEASVFQAMRSAVGLG
ncbi:shikimate dehydrogenase family protein [Lacisediminihabitans changchengi]|uniref:shikimate dehydrogenase family protein n=1 Tax=Lacisediminihabitans changchengi TaxID=2787634 RepID=UPI0027DC9ED9|nr:shikimate dehydrogenase [Lacisediminihabitans changchengi]